VIGVLRLRDMLGLSDQVHMVKKTPIVVGRVLSCSGRGECESKARKHSGVIQNCHSDECSKVVAAFLLLSKVESMSSCPCSYILSRGSLQRLSKLDYVSQALEDLVKVYWISGGWSAPLKLGCPRSPGTWRDVD
jgi:hypothetical protein